MRIRIRQSIYRDRYGVEHHAGDVANLPDHIGVKLIGHGIAEPVDDAAPVEQPKPARKNKEKSETPKPKTTASRS